MSGRILVADADARRGQAVAAACTARGLACRVTTHGVAALEAALSELPDALVCQLDLPLIDGRTLASILAANPRTESTPVVFLADESGEAEHPGITGPVVPAPVDPEQVAGCAVAAVGERGPAVEKGGAEGGVQGQLSQLPLVDLLELFHVSRKTGSVEVSQGSRRSGRSNGRIVLRDGDVVDASVGGVRGDKALFRLLAWERGRFSFRPAPIPDEVSIETPTRALLREGQRQIREWKRLGVQLPGPSATVTLRVPRASLPNVIHPLTQEVLVALDAASQVQDVVDRCAHPDYQVLRTLHTLVQRGLVELQEDPRPAKLGREALFPPPRTARMREWLGADRPGVPAARDAKLAVVASGPEALRDFAQLVRGLPGATLEAGVEDGAIGTDDLLTMARLEVDAEVGIELVHVPGHPRFAPLWPAAGHGALATLLLLSGPVGRAVEAVQPVVESLSRLPRARIVHVWLLGKGERVDPKELGEHLSIVDEGSLFLVPLESPEKANVLLREIFGRVLP